MQDLIHTILNELADVSPATVADVLRQTKRLELPKGTILLNEGEVARHTYFIESGFARGFYYDSGGRERTSWFWAEYDMMVSYKSFVDQLPTIENVQLLEDAVLHRISYDNMMGLYERHTSLNVVARRMAEQAFFRAGELTHMLRSGSSRENYEALIDKYPQLVNRAYLKDIASYLGVSQETISRIRSARAAEGRPGKS